MVCGLATLLVSSYINAQEINDAVNLAARSLESVPETGSAPYASCGEQNTNYDQQVLQNSVLLEDTSESWTKRYSKMCGQAMNVLMRMKEIDPGNNLILSCEKKHRDEERSLLFMHKTLRFHQVEGSYSGRLGRSCPNSETLHEIRVPVISTHVSAKKMPAGVNPYLKDMAEKLGLRHELEVEKDYTGTVTSAESVIRYPVCP